LAAAHAADRLAAEGLDRCDRQERQRRSTALPAATLIRHAPRDQASAVLALAVAVVEPSFRASLMPAIGRATLLAAALIPAALGAVALASVAQPADVEHRTARPGSAKALS
jgi:hypothetical protein